MRQKKELINININEAFSSADSPYRVPLLSTHHPTDNGSSIRAYDQPSQSSHSPHPQFKSPRSSPPISVEAYSSDGTDDITRQTEGVKLYDPLGNISHNELFKGHATGNTPFVTSLEDGRYNPDNDYHAEHSARELSWNGTIDRSTSGEQDITPQTRSKEFTQMSSMYPELVNAPSTLLDGFNIVSHISWTSIVYTIFSSLPSFLALLCLLLSNRPNAIHETAAFALGVSVSNVLWGIGLSLGGGMDLKASEAVLDESLNLCWKLLIKCSCVAFWYFILVTIPLIIFEERYNFLTSAFNRLIGDDVGHITTTTINIYGVGYLATYFFESFNRFLSYQNLFNSQFVLIFIGSLLHCILLISIVWQKQQGPEVAAMIYSSISSVRAFSLVFYVYLKRYELGWQSGVRLRLFKRERKPFGSAHRQSVPSPQQPPVEISALPEQRRRHRVATCRPVPLLPDTLSAFQSCGSFETERIRSDSLHPITAATYAADKEAEKLKNLEKEAESWYNSPSVPLSITSTDRKSKETIPYGISTETTLTLPSREKSNDVLATFAVPVRRTTPSENELKLESITIPETSTVLSQVMVNQTPHSHSQEDDDADDEISKCDGATKSRSFKKLSFKSPTKRSSSQNARSRGRVDFHAAPTKSQPVPPSLFQTRRLCRRLTSSSIEDTDIESPLDEHQAAIQQSVFIEGGETDEQKKKAAVARRKRKREKTVVSVHSVSVDNYLVLDGCCLPATLSWQTYWNIQLPRQLRETKEFLVVALLSAFLLSLEFLSFDVLIIIASLMGPSSLAVFSLIITLNTLLDSIPIGIASSISGQIRFLVQLDNIASAKTIIQITTKLILCASGLCSFSLILFGLVCASIFKHHNDDLFYQSINELPYCFNILALIVLTDGLVIFLTSCLRGSGLLLSSLLSVGLILGILMPFSLLIGILVFSVSTVQSLLIVFGCILLLCVVAFIQLALESQLFAQEPFDGLHRRELPLPFLSLKTARRGPVECRSLVYSFPHISSSPSRLGTATRHGSSRVDADDRD